MAKIKTSSNGRRYLENVEIDGVIERRLEQIKKSQNGRGNGGYQKPATREDASHKTGEASDPRGRSVPAT